MQLGGYIMLINGLVKTSLVDYPGHVAATLFTSGCNMHCPFCHNKDLVINADTLKPYTEAEILDFLNKRRTILEGICITGGEPTLQPDLIKFIEKLKSLGYKIKLDTNGLNPDIIELLAEKTLIDYIAMDIKNSPSKYSLTAGLPQINITRIEKSINIIRTSSINYEFRTTVTKELHKQQDFEEIAAWLSGSHKYVLQPYKNTGNQLEPVIFSTYTYEELLKIKQKLFSSINIVELRGF